MSDSKPYILVKFNKPIQTTLGCTDLLDNFVIKIGTNLIGSRVITPINIVTDTFKYPGHILMELNLADVPKVDEKIFVTYIPTVNCNLVDLGLSNKLINFGNRTVAFSDVTSDKFGNEALAGDYYSTHESDLPRITKIEARNQDGGKVIYATFTEGRDISNNSKDISLNFYAVITKDKRGTNKGLDVSLCQSETVYQPLDVDGIQRVSTAKNKLKLKFQDSSVRIQRYDTFDISYELSANKLIVDQFDLSLSPFSSAADISGWDIASKDNSTWGDYRGVICENNIKSPFFHQGWVHRSNPREIYAIFKDNSSASFNTDYLVDISMAGNAIAGKCELNDFSKNIFQIRFKSRGGIKNQTFDASSVEIVSLTRDNIPIALRQADESLIIPQGTTVKGLKMSFKMMAIPPQSSADGIVGIYWNSSNLDNCANSVVDNCKLKDKFGNVILNSEHDPLAGVGRYAGDLDGSACNIFNNIRGIDYSGTLQDISSLKASSFAWDTCMNCIIQFKKEYVDGDVEGVPTNYIKVTDNNRTAPTDFTIDNVTSGKEFSPDRYKITDNSNISFCIDFCQNDFTKAINKNDLIRWRYEPPPHHVWPSTIEDPSGGYMVRTDHWVGENTYWKIINKMDLSGEIDFLGHTSSNPDDPDWDDPGTTFYPSPNDGLYPHYVKGSLSVDTKNIYIKFDVDICGTTLENMSAVDVSNAFSIAPGSKNFQNKHGSNSPYVPDSSFAFQSAKLDTSGPSRNTIVLELNYPIWNNLSTNINEPIMRINFNNTEDIIWDKKGIRNINGLKLESNHSTYLSSDFTAIDISLGDIKAPGADSGANPLLTKYPTNKKQFNNYANIYMRVDPPIEVTGSSVNTSDPNDPNYMDLSGFRYGIAHPHPQYSTNKNSVGYDNTGPSIGDFSFCRVPVSDVEISEDGYYIILKTKFRKNGGVQGLSKFDTSNNLGGEGGWETPPAKGVFVYYIPDVATKGIWSGGGILPQLPTSAPQEAMIMLDPSNSILDPSINIGSIGIDFATSLSVSNDVSAVMAFHDYPNTLYLRMQQPDLSGATFDNNNVWWYDICNINISNINNRQTLSENLRIIPDSFEISYNNISTDVCNNNIKDVSAINGDGDWSEDTRPDLLKTKEISACWIGITISGDFIPPTGSINNNLTLSYNTPIIPNTVDGSCAGIFDQNGGLLQSFSIPTSSLNSNIKWSDDVTLNSSFARPKIGFGGKNAPQGLEQTAYDESNKTLWLWPKNWINTKWCEGDKIFQYFSDDNDSDGAGNYLKNTTAFQVRKKTDDSLIATSTDISFGFDDGAFFGNDPSQNYIQILFDISLVTGGPWGPDAADSQDISALVLSYTKPVGRKGLMIGVSGTSFKDWDWVRDFNNLPIQNDFIQPTFDNVLKPVKIPTNVEATTTDTANSTLGGNHAGQLFFEISGLPITAPSGAKFNVISSTYPSEILNTGASTSKFGGKLGTLPQPLTNAVCELIDDGSTEFPSRSTKFRIYYNGAGNVHDDWGVAQYKNDISLSYDPSPVSLGKTAWGGLLKAANAINVKDVNVKGAITPFFNDTTTINCISISGGYIDTNAPDKICFWFNNGVDLIDLSESDLSDNCFRIISKSIKLSDNQVYDVSEHVLEIFDCSVVNIPTIKTGIRDVSGVSMILKKQTIDISLNNKTNPYAFSQNDKLYVWWTQHSSLLHVKRLQDLSGNEVWDASAQSLAGGANEGISGNIKVGGDFSITNSNLGGISVPRIFGHNIRNDIIDITGLSGSIYGDISGKIGDWCGNLQNAYIKIHVKSPQQGKLKAAVDLNSNSLNVKSVNENWLFTNSTFLTDISRQDICGVHVIGSDANQYIKLDISSCMVKGFDSSFNKNNNNTLKLKNISIDPSFNENIRDTLGNYLRYGNIDLNLNMDTITTNYVKAIIQSVETDKHYPSRLYFTVNTPITVPHNMLRYEIFDICFNNNTDAPSDISFNENSEIKLDTTHSSYIYDTENAVFVSKRFYIEAAVGQIQPGLSPPTQSITNKFTNIEVTGKYGRTVNGYVLDSSGSLSITGIENIETPYYSGGSAIDTSKPESIYLWFEKEGNLVNMDTNTKDINGFKIITKGKQEVPGSTAEISYNILDIASITTVDIDSTKTGSTTIKGIRVDLSQNNTDLSNVTNPYSLSQGDNIWVWWNQSDISEAKRIRDISTNQLWDINKQKSVHADGSNSDIKSSNNSRDIVAESTRNLTTHPFLGGMAGKTKFFGMSVTNNIEDISGISAELIGDICGQAGIWTDNYVSNAYIKVYMKSPHKGNLVAQNIVHADLNTEWGFKNSSITQDVCGVLVTGTGDNQYIKLDVSCALNGENTTWGTNNLLITKLNKNPTITLNVRDLSGNYLRYEKIKLDISNSVVLSFVEANIQNMYIDNSNNKQLVFETNEAIWPLADSNNAANPVFVITATNDINAPKSQETSLSWPLQTVDLSFNNIDSPPGVAAIKNINANNEIIHTPSKKFYLNLCDNTQYLRDFANPGKRIQYKCSFTVAEFINTGNLYTPSGGRTSTGGLIKSLNNLIDISKNQGLTVPYYPETSITSTSNSYVNESDPSSIYFWFNKDGNDGIDLNDNSLNPHHFKIIYGSTSPYHILDVNTATIVDILKDSGGTNCPHKNIKGVKIDVSANESTDISAHTNPISFSQYDKLWVWWDSNVSDSLKLQYKAPHEKYSTWIWDSSCQKYSAPAYGRIPWSTHPSTLLDNMTRDFTVNPFIDPVDNNPMPEEGKSYGQEISNNIIDITTSSLNGRNHSIHIIESAHDVGELVHAIGEIKLYTNVDQETVYPHGFIRDLSEGTGYYGTNASEIANYWSLENTTTAKGIQIWDICKVSVVGHDSLDQYIKFDISGNIECPDPLASPPHWTENTFDISLIKIHPTFTKNIQDKYKNYLHKGRATVTDIQAAGGSNTWTIA